MLHNIYVYSYLGYIFIFLLIAKFSLFHQYVYELSALPYLNMIHLKKLREQKKISHDTTKTLNLKSEEEENK
jgi:hypothetical protein